jgi:zinc D-Ala-D-Ala dipeptidase
VKLPEPIPRAAGASDGAAPVLENGEPLVVVVSANRIVVSPQYWLQRYRGAQRIVRVRRSVGEALTTASNSLPPGLSLVLWDGLRSVETQREIARRFREVLGANAVQEELIERFVARVPDGEREFAASPPPHCTGGAVDVTLGDEKGRPLDLGADFDEFSERAELSHFERPALSQADRNRRNRRRLLYWAMINAGFAPYASEFWHFEIGTRRAAAFHEFESAKYGPATPWQGESHVA